jgi:hypothetical protein
MRKRTLDKITSFEAEAAELHRRSRAAANLPASIILRFRALWKEEAARLLLKRSR